MMTFQVNASLPTAKEGRSHCSQRGPDAAGHQVHNLNFGMGTGRGQAALRQNSHMRGTFPAIQPLSKSRDWKALVSGIIAGGSPDLAKDGTLELQTVLEKDICGRHFLFDKKCTRLEKTRTVIPPLPRDYHANRELSHCHAGHPLTPGYPERYELNTSPAILFPSALVLNSRNTFAVDNCKLSRPKVNYPTYNLLTVKDNPKSQAYPDPVVGASRSFIHRISELSSLEGETARQEKLKKMRKPRKPPS